MKTISKKSILAIIFAVIANCTVFAQGINCKLGGNNNVSGNNDWVGSQNNADFKLKANNQLHINLNKDGTTEFFGKVEMTVDTLKVKGYIETDSMRIKGVLHIGDSSLTIGGISLGSSDLIQSNHAAISFGRTPSVFPFPFVDYSQIKVGIGTQTPNYKLQLYDQPSIYSYPPHGIPVYMQITNTTIGGGTGKLATDGLLIGIAGDGTAQLIQQENADFIFRRNGIQSGLLNNALLNTSWGVGALNSATTGTNNTATGYSSLYSNTTGSDNTANGVNALYYNTRGFSNTANGVNALYNNTIGNWNTAVGYKALYANTYISPDAGEFNTAVGAEALSANTIGNNNTANGYYALGSNNTGIWNTANGASALQNNTTGGYNTATGKNALLLNKTGFSNTANGGSALEQNISACNNVAIGTRALWSQSYNPGFTWSSDNVAAGYLALYKNQPITSTSGRQNTAIGNSALFNNTIGSYNTALGYEADVCPTCITYSNCTSLGYQAIVPTGFTGNYVRVGNTSVTDSWVKVDWTIGSDRRIKNTIKENVPGLAFINQLKPVTFHYNIHIEDSILGYPTKKDSLGNVIGIDTSYWQGKYDIEKITYTGLIAQQVDSAAQNIGYDFSGLNKTGPVMGLRYAEFTFPLIKAVQELSNTIDTITGRLDSNFTIVKQLDSAVTALQNSPSGVFGNGTENYITKWQNADTIISSQIIDNGTNVGIGGISVDTKFYVLENSPSFLMTRAGYFISTGSSSFSHGLTGEASGGANENVGVQGVASSSSSFYNYGMRGFAYGSNINMGGNFGAFGTGTNYGIYASTQGSYPNNVAGYFTGDVYSSGTYLGSDAILKDNISPLTDAMSIINQLSPKTFTFKTSQYPQMNLPTGSQMGLIAQDVETILPNLVKEVVQPEVLDTAGNIVNAALTFKSLKYEAFIPILIQGSKEQQSTIDSLKTQIQVLQNQMAQVLGNNGGAKIINNEPTTQTDVALSNRKIVLDQNAPNPFKDQTTITYEIKTDFSTAIIIFTDNLGQVIKEVPITQKGKGQLNVYASDLTSGIYTYTIVVDGNTIDSKKMVKMK